MGVKGLSPLVSTVILIGATVIGGLLVYNYFQQSLETVKTIGQSLLVSGSWSPLNGTHKLVYVEVMNTYDEPVNISNSFKVVLSDGSIINVPVVTDVNTINPVSPGQKVNLIVIVPRNAVSLIVVYEMSGRVLEASPVNIQ